jgi:high-affinity nickel-transport protein
MPDDPFRSYGRPAAFGIGMLHGVGAETPTQVVILAAAAGAGGTASGVAILVAFIVGLLSSNALIGLAGTFGFLSATKSWTAYVAISVVTAVASLLVGTVLLLGGETILPAFFSG